MARRVSKLRPWMSEEQREKQRKVIDDARKDAVTVEIDGEEFTLVRIPDSYPESGPTGKLRPDEQEVLANAREFRD